MNKIFWVFLISSVLFVSGCIAQIDESKIKDNIPDRITIDPEFIQTITYENNTEKTIITKNKMDKTAFIEIISLSNHSQLKEYEELAKFSIVFGCNKLTEFFKNLTESDYEKATRKWNKLNRTIEDENISEDEINQINKNALGDYEIKSVRFTVLNLLDKSQISECLVTGPSEEDIKINITGLD